MRMIHRLYKIGAPRAGVYWQYAIVHRHLLECGHPLCTQVIHYEHVVFGPNAMICQVTNECLQPPPHKVLVSPRLWLNAQRMFWRLSRAVRSASVGHDSPLKMMTGGTI